MERGLQSASERADQSPRSDMAETQANNPKKNKDAKKPSEPKTVGEAKKAEKVPEYWQLTDDEVFVSHEAAVQGVTFENTGLEPLVSLRYFGPHTNIDAPAVGDYKKKKR